MVICAKTAEPMKMPFEFWVQMGPKNHALDGGPDGPREGLILRGKGAPIAKYRDFMP